MEEKPVKDATHLLKNERLGSVVNTDSEAYRSALARKRRAKEVQALRSEVEDLRRRIEALERHINTNTTQ